MISLDFIEKVDVFSGLSDDQLSAVQSCCEEADFRRGDSLFKAGEEPRHLWVVVEGQVDLIWDAPGVAGSSGESISQLGPGMPFGWSSLVPPNTYRLSAVGASRTGRVMKVDAAGLRAIFETDAVVGYKVMSKVLALISTRFYQLQDEVARRRGHDIINQW